MSEMHNNDHSFLKGGREDELEQLRPLRQAPGDGRIVEPDREDRLAPRSVRRESVRLRLRNGRVSLLSAADQLRTSVERAAQLREVIVVVRGDQGRPVRARHAAAIHVDAAPLPLGWCERGQKNQKLPAAPAKAFERLRRILPRVLTVFRPSIGVERHARGEAARRCPSAPCPEASPRG